MRHAVDGKKFGRNTSHRLAMFRNTANSLIQAEQIVTTVAKAREIRRVVDRLVTLGKSGKPASRRLAFDRTRSNPVVAKLFGVLAERFKDRHGGYTRILKVSGTRRGDSAEMAILELVDRPEINRRKKKAPSAAGGEAPSQGDAQGTPVAAKDPMSRFRRLFSPGKKLQASGTKAMSARQSGGGASKRSPSAGGGGKQGGSS